jgi:hypothetical protein
MSPTSTRQTLSVRIQRRGNEISIWGEREREREGKKWREERTLWALENEGVEMIEEERRDCRAEREGYVGPILTQLIQDCLRMNVCHQSAASKQER